MSTRNRVIFRTIPLTQIIRQVNGPPQNIAVYNFGSVQKFEREDMPGSVYAWARGVREEYPPDNEGME